MHYRYQTLGISLLLFSQIQFCTAQSLPCPTPKRQKVYTEPPKFFLDFSGGVSFPILYRNTGSMASHFKFSSRPGPYLAATGHLKSHNGWELTLEIELLQNQQGLVFQYNEGSVKVRERGYTGSLVVRVPVGIGYYITPKWTINGTAFIAYTSFWTYTNSGSQSINGNGNGSLSSQHQWIVPDAYNHWYPGISFNTQANLLGRLGARAFWSMDFGQATPNAGTVAIANGSNSEILKATLEPYLMNIGLTLTYRLGKLEDEQ